MDTPKPPRPPIPPKKSGAGMSPPLPPSGRKPLLPPTLGSPGSAVIESGSSADMGKLLERIDRRSGDMVDSKKMLEDQLKQLEQKLHEEREKALLANIRGKEEAALSSKIELSLKDMQDKMRREKREHELETSNRRMREDYTALEEKLRTERETWMKTLQEQMDKKGHQEQKMEIFFSQKLSVLEKKWCEEKNELLSQARNKEAECSNQSAKHTVEIEKLTTELEHKIRILEHDFQARLHEEKERGLQLKRERDLLTENFEEKEQEFITLKAQIALIHSQVTLEKEKLNQTWAETLKQKEEEVKTFKEQFLQAELQCAAEVKKKIQDIDEKWVEERAELNAKIEQENMRHTEAETHMRILIAEAEARRDRAEEKLSYAQAEEKTVDNSLQVETERLTNELLSERKKQDKERTLWKTSLQEIEEKLLKQKKNQDHAESADRLRCRELQEQLKEKNTNIAKIEEEHNALKNKFWEERDVWGQIAAVKDDELQKMYDRINAFTEALKEKETLYWNEKEKTVEELKEKEIELSRLRAKEDELSRLSEHVSVLQSVVNEKDKMYWEEKEKSAKELKEKESEISQLKAKEDELERIDGHISNFREEIKEKERLYWEEKEKVNGLMQQHNAEMERIVKEKNDQIADLSQKVTLVQLKTRDQLEKEYQHVLAHMEKKNREWAENVRKQYEGTAALKERSLREELRAVQNKMNDELKELEKKYTDEKVQRAQRIAEKERLLHVEAQSIEEKYVFQIDLLKKEMDQKDTWLESLREPHNARQADGQPPSKEEVLEDKIHELENLQHKNDEESQQQHQEISALDQKIHDELDSLEHKVFNINKPKTLLGKFWYYLNRTIMIISVRRGRRIE